MNKAQLNRKIQLLEQSNEELQKVVQKLTRTNCPQCNQIRKDRLDSLMAPFLTIQAMLASVDTFY
jgi:hypothetical protein